MKSSKRKRAPVMAAMCKTCPFRQGSKYQYLVEYLTESAISNASRIYHSTGSSGILGNTGKPDRLCRGARDVQLKVFHGMGFIEAATDEAWEKKCKEMNL